MNQQQNIDFLSALIELIYAINIEKWADIASIISGAAIIVGVAVWMIGLYTRRSPFKIVEIKFLSNQQENHAIALRIKNRSEITHTINTIYLLGKKRFRVMEFGQSTLASPCFKNHKTIPITKQNIVDPGAEFSTENYLVSIDENIVNDLKNLEIGTNRGRFIIPIKTITSSNIAGVISFDKNTSCWLIYRFHLLQHRWLRTKRWCKSLFKSK